MDESAAERDEVAAAEGLVTLAVTSAQRRRAARAGLGALDVHQEAYAALCEAAEDWTDSRDGPFPAFAVRQIRRRIGRAIRQARRSRPRDPATLDGPDRSDPPVDRHRERASTWSTGSSTWWTP